MKKLYGYLICFICILTSQGIVAGDEQNVISSVKKSYETDYKKDEILVKYKPSRSPLSEKTAQTRSGFSEIKTFRKTGIQQIKITGNMDVEHALEIYRNDPNVEYAEPNYCYHISKVPNDPHFEKQWALADSWSADIDAIQAWDITTGSPDVVVAAIDTGVDYNHPDLLPNIWINQGEIPDNGIDDDQNGKIDDVRGWDFVDSDNDPIDYNGHGTHVAGIIAAVGNNGIGVAGVSWSARIMALRGFDTDGYGYANDLIDALDYADKNGAHIINLSWGGENYSKALEDAIGATSAIVVCAAGNDGTDNDITPNYPSGYDSPNIISVAATDKNGNLESFSNFGVDSVDIGAPGDITFSTVGARDIVWSDDSSDWTTGGTNNTWGFKTISTPLSTYYTVNSLADSPDGYYENNTESWAMSPSFDLTDKKGSRLVFTLWGESEPENDILYVQTSSDGISWINRETIDGSIYYSIHALDISDHDNSDTVYVRFLFITNATETYKGYHICDLSVTYSAPYNGTEYDYMFGTSVAAPYVSGTAALIKALKPELTDVEIKSAILDNVDYDTALAEKVLSAGRLNAFNALRVLIPCEEISITMPESATEGDGILTGQSYVSIASPIEEDLKIHLSANSSRIKFPSSITIPAGETSAEFDIEIIDNNILDSTESVAVFFTIYGCTEETEMIQIYDNDIPSLSIQIPEDAMEEDGVLSGQAMVSSGLIMGYDAAVNLLSDNPGKITVPASVTILKGQNTASFDITIIDNQLKDGPQVVNITASVEGWGSADDSITVGDADIVSWVEDTNSTSLTYILRDDMRDRIYLADAGNRHLVVIDSESLEIIIRLPVDSSFLDMAISKDNKTMAIAGKTLTLVDLDTFEKRKLSLEIDVVSAAFDHRGDLMLSTSEGWDYLYHYDPDSETIMNTFGNCFDNSGLIYENSLVRTDAEGKELYVGQRGISPGSLYKFDISGDSPVCLVEDDHGDIGGIPDFLLSPRYDEIYIPTQPIQIIDSNTIDTIGQLDSGGYDRAIALDREGFFLYNSFNDIYTDSKILNQFDLNQRKLLMQYSLVPETSNDIPQGRGLAIERTGKRAFIIMGDKYSTPNFRVQAVELSLPLNISLPHSVTEGDGILENEGVLTVMEPLSKDLIISLASDDTNAVQVPESVAMPAGETSVVFDITILDNVFLDGTRSVNVTAMASDYPPASDIINVHDNETAILTLEVPSSVTEDDGLLIEQGIMSVNKTVEDDVAVSLSVDRMGEISLPRTVTIPAGQTSATFDLNVIDDTKIEGPHSVTITAYVEGWSKAQAIIEISDNEVAELKVADLKTFCEGDGTVTDGGIVSISGTLPFDLEVALSYNDMTEIEVPSTVIIPAWQTSAEFDIEVIDDSVKDGIQFVTISASAEGFSDGSVKIAITDNDNITWIDDTYSTSLTCILRDDERDVIYLGDEGSSQLVVLDSISLNVILRLTIESRFTDMAISKDKSKMAVAGGTLFLVDLETFEAHQLPVDLDVISTAFDNNGDLMLLTSEEEGYIYHYDPDTEEVVKYFGAGSDLTDAVSGTYLKTDADGKMLYVGSYYKFDISGDSAVFLAKNTGTGGVYFSVSPEGDQIYAAGGSPNGINILDSNTLEYMYTLETAPYAGGVAIDPGGYYIYGLTNSTYNNKLYQFDRSYWGLNFHYNLQQEQYNDVPQSNGIAIDRSGRRAFIIFGQPYEPDTRLKVQVVELNIPFSISLPHKTKEGDGVPGDQGIVQVLTAPSEDLTVYLESSDTTEVQVPESVTIQAGHTSATFDIHIMDDSILDGTQISSIAATAENYPSTFSSIHVGDDESAELTLLIPGRAAEGDGLLPGQGSVSVARAVEDDVKVFLTADKDGEILFPPIVVIPSGEESVTFDLYVVDDNEIEDPLPVAITASVEGWVQSRKTIVIDDNEIPEMVLSIPEFFSENDRFGTGTVSISGALSYDLYITLYSDDTTVISVPFSVKIPAGQISVNFEVKIEDDTEKDGIQIATITAETEDFSNCVVEVIVSDNENITWIDDAKSSSLTCILRDDIRDVIYLGDAGNNQLVVIDSNSLEITHRIIIESSFSDMAISKDNSKMAVAGGTLFLVDLETFATRKISTELDVFSAAFDHRGDLMLMTSEEYDYIYHFDPDTESILDFFGADLDLSKTIYRNGLLKTDSKGLNLYVMEREYSASIYKYDISGENPVFLDEISEEFGIADFFISPRLNEIYMTSNSPYGIKVLDSSTTDFIHMLETDAFPRGVTTDMGGFYVYGLINGSGKVLFQFDAVQRDLLYYYRLESEIHNGSASPRGIAVDRSGKRAFIIHGGDYYETDYFKVQVVELCKVPVAHDQNINMYKNGDMEITMSASDLEGKDLTYLIMNQVKHGVLIGNNPNLVYSPDTDYYGSDSFTFKVNNGLFDSNIAIVNINILAVNDPPLADSKIVRMIKDRSLDILLTGNDSVEESLAFYIVTQPSNGTLSGTAPNIIYTPNLGFSGSDSFTFKVNDGSLDSNIAEISINVLDRAPAGDVDGSANVELGDAIIALQLSTNIPANAEIYKEADVNDDNRIGVEEAIYIMRKVAGMGEE